MKAKQIQWLILKYVVVLGAVSTLCAGCFIWTSNDQYKPALQHHKLADGAPAGSERLVLL